ncbi:MraY family glycosyltransferase [Bacillus spongiae]|uniref:MraY family glycosyltransferase n=1 Tax=Bacillus spongiae TaxID=2683610 RepID=A0ABU8HEH9_9BACI
MIVVALVSCLLFSLAITPFVIKFAVKIGAVDQPDFNRKVHQKVMPRIGGIAIYLSFLVGIMIIRPDNELLIPILIGSLVIILTGLLDDLFQLTPKIKLVGQSLAAAIVILGGIQVEFINLPFGGVLEFGVLSIPITVLWIIGITNAINFIDGLDGLSAGVSLIGIMTIGFMSLLMGDMFVLSISVILCGSILGFLPYNFYPAKIFMGDTGALFLGFMIAVVSLLGFKNVTVISLIIPVIILGVPISDTLFAIIRRKVNRQPISAPDRSHLHHCLLNLGYTHKQTVIVIYAISTLFGLIAIIFSQATIWGGIILIGVVILAIELFVESIGLIGKEYRPILKLIGGEKDK